MIRESATEVEDQAVSWVVRMDSEDWDSQAQAELERWIAADPRHDGALLAAQAAWSMLGPRPTLPETLDDRERTPPSASELRAVPAAPAARALSRRRLVAGGLGAVAACAIGVMIVGAPGVRYTTRLGEVRRIPLADGSTASVNTASAVRIAFENDVRRVVVERGESWFQVSKNKDQPFVVEAGPIRVRAVGTAFAVRRHAAGADVLVTEGVVEAWSVDGGGRLRILAGQRAFIAASGAPAASTTAPVERALAWRHGKIDLTGQPLREAVDEFNRYNARHIVLRDPALGDEAFDGVFRTDDPQGFARMVHVSLGTPLDLSDPDQIYLGAPRR
jgi:transmembrane sensor